MSIDSLSTVELTVARTVWSAVCSGGGTIPATVSEPLENGSINGAEPLTW